MILDRVASTLLKIFPTVTKDFNILRKNKTLVSKYSFPHLILIPKINGLQLIVGLYLETPNTSPANQPIFEKGKT